MWDPYAEFESATLPNGLSVYAAHWPNRPWESVGFLVHSGAKEDPEGLEGSAHFVEHLVSFNAPISHKEIHNFFEDHGGGCGLGATSQRSTRYTFFAPIDEPVILQAFQWYGHMLLQGKLVNFFERERRVIMEEFARDVAYAKLEHDLRIRLRRALFHGWWLERSPTALGTLESVQRISQADAQQFYDTYYTPANISIVGVGGMKLEELLKVISQSPFAMDKPGRRTPLSMPVDKVSLPLENRCIVEDVKHTTASYTSGCLIPGNADPAIRILRSMLSELLDDQVRQEHALTYSIGCSWENYGYFFLFEINCSSFNPAATQKVERIIEECIALIPNREDLFEAKKRRLLAGIYMDDFKAGQVRNGVMDDLSLFGRIRPLAEEFEKIKALQMKDVCNLLEWLQFHRRCILVKKP